MPSNDEEYFYGVPNAKNHGHTFSLDTMQCPCGMTATQYRAQRNRDRQPCRHWFKNKYPQEYESIYGSLGSDRANNHGHKFATDPSGRCLCGLSWEGYYWSNDKKMCPKVVEPDHKCSFDTITGRCKCGRPNPAIEDKDDFLMFDLFKTPIYNEGHTIYKKTSTTTPKATRTKKKPAPEPEKPKVEVMQTRFKRRIELE